MKNHRKIERQAAKLSQLAGLVFLIFFALIGSAQEQRVKFSKVAGTNGMSLGKINNMTMDKYGFMWFSDQSNRSIIRYDGIQMKRFKNDPNNPNSLGGYYPECLFTDTSGIIWIGFYGQGLDRFDPASHTFTHYRHDDNDESSLSNDFVSAVLVDHLGNIWVGTDEGLDLLDEKTGTFRHFRNDPNDSTSLSYNLVRAIYEDHGGTLWIGTGLAWEGNERGGLNRYNRDKNNFSQYLHDPKDHNSLVNNKLRAILEDSRGTFWVGTAGDGLHTMDRSSGRFTRYLNDPLNPDKLSRTPLGADVDNITFLEEDVAGQIWIGTMFNGISRYDPLGETITHFGVAGSQSEFEDNSGWWAQANDDGIIWVTTQQANLYKIDLYSDFIPHTGNSPDDGTTSFCEESEDIFWIGTPDGLIRKDLKNGSMTRFIHEPDNSNSLSNSSIKVLVKDRQGHLWIGTESGLNHFDPNTRIFARFLDQVSPEFTEPNHIVTAILEDDDSNIWIGTEGNGLFKLHRNNGEITSFRYDRPNPNSLASNNILSLDLENNSDIWVGHGANTGISKLNRFTGQAKNYLSGLIVGSIYRDADSVMWVGVPEGGLYRYDRASDVFVSIGEDNAGLEVPNVFAMTGDKDNNLWIATASGICKLNEERDHVTWFRIEHGIHPETEFGLQGAYTKENGEVYFTDERGYYSFFPSPHSLIRKKTYLYFTNFWIDDKELFPSDDGPLKTSLLESGELILNYNQNVFSIAFTAVNFRQNESSNIQYKFENYDDNWHLSGSDNKAHFYKVPSGEYVFRIKTPESSSEDWIEKSMAITILPPWWQTWWAYLAYGVLFVSGVVTIHRYQKSRVLRAEREKARERELEQAREIEKAYTKLKETQSQLIHSEKMASLGELTAGIAHEIQNPLNFVNNFSDVSKELLLEMKEELESGNHKDVAEISNDLITNLEKIRHHGDRAATIVKGMLMHSRSDTGERVMTDLNALCDEYLRLAYHGLRARDESFNSGMETDFEENLPKIEIVPQDIGRVLLNLITNAFYVVSEKSKSREDRDYKPLVTVRTRVNNGLLNIAVIDNGPGIPEEIKDKIFQPFFTTKPTGQGTGLGLSLSYDIVKAHGGEISVVSEAGLGTTFTISLPTK
ncbi:MAG: ATP-binding protein [Saprospiraceae bacterium]|nr:ATP-binding protein [Saprospiraceae bacterium]